MSTHRPRRAARLVVAAALCISGILSGGAQPISADDVGNASSQVNNAQNNLNNAKGRSAADQSAINRLTGEIQSLQTSVAQLQAVIATLDGQIATQQTVVQRAQAKLDQLTSDLEAANVALAQIRQQIVVDQNSLTAQMVKMYEQPPSSTVNAIFGSSTFDELWQQINAAKRVGDAMQTAIDRVRQEKVKQDQLIAHISDEKAQQAQTLAQMQAAEAALEQDRHTRADDEARLQQAEADDQAKQAQIEADKREVDSEVAADAAKLAAAKAAYAKALAEAAARSGSAGGNGHFMWPEQGPISQYFGCTSWPYENYDPGCPFPHRFHTGLDIADPWGTPIVAADTGIVFTYYSGFGYGNHLIIVHGNGWTSLYGHMSSFSVGNGQVVGRGQLIGYEGSSGNSTGPHLHFEIRLNNIPRNPLDYLP